MAVTTSLKSTAILVIRKLDKIKTFSILNKLLCTCEYCVADKILSEPI